MKKEMKQIINVGNSEIQKGLCTVNFHIRVYFKSFINELSNENKNCQDITHALLYDLLIAAEEVKTLEDGSFQFEMGNGIKIIVWDKILAKLLIPK